MSKPIMQDIADSLSTSRISVWKALNDKSGVSDELREKILEKAAEIGYIKKSDGAAANDNSSIRTIAAVVSRPESSIFWMQIIHRIAKELSKHHVNLMYVYMPTRYKAGDTLPAVLCNGAISGIIVLNVYSEQQLKMLAELPIPKVFLDSIPSVPVDTLNGDVVLIEGRAAVKKITKRLLTNGYTNLGFVGDIQYAQTNMDRFLGFTDAMEDFGIKHDSTYILTDRLHLDTHYQQISEFLGSLKSLPDGFVCASDYIAHFIKRYITENDIDASGLVLTGFDNTSEYPNVAEKITTVDVKTDSMGERLANKIIFAVNHPDIPHEISYVLTKPVYRSPL